MNELELGAVLDRIEIGQIAGVGQRVEDHQVIARMGFECPHDAGEDSRIV